VGEAMLPDIKPRQEAFIAYSVELKCDVTEETDEELRDVYRTEVGQWDYSKGYLYLHRNRVKKVIYIIENKHEDEEVDLFIEHPRKGGHNLIETDKPDETKDHFYRFRVKVPKKDVVKFVVSEEISATETYNLADVTKAQADQWFNKGYINEEVRKQCYSVIAYNEENKARSFEKSLVDTSVAEFSADVRRIEDILSAINQSGSQAKFKNFFSGELQTANKGLNPKKEESAKLAKKINKTNKRKQRLLNKIKFATNIDISKKKEEKVDDDEGKNADKKGKGKVTLDTHKTGGIKGMIQKISPRKAKD